MPEAASVLAFDNVSKHFPGRGRDVVRAVDGVSLEVTQGETLALVGESGCGKSTLARLALRLDEPTAGRVLLAGDDVGAISARAFRPQRRTIQMIFQDPYASLDPRMDATAVVREPLDNFRVGAPSERSQRARGLLSRVGLGSEFHHRYPHELSGGQRQRLGIARALALEPNVIVADEPVSALDVSIRAQVLNLLNDIQREFGLSMLFVSHDIGVVAKVSDRIAVMYLGRIVEQGPTAEILKHPRHPYTQALLAAAPAMHPDMRRSRRPLEGDPPSPSRPPPGCHFHTRCPIAEARCKVERPQLRHATADVAVACHLAMSEPAPRAQIKSFDAASRA